MQVDLTTDELVAFLNSQLANQVAAAVVAQLKPLIEELLAMSGTQQADIDALTTAVNAAVTNLTAFATAIQAEIANLQAANPGVDTSALDTAVANLTNEVAAMSAIATPPSGP